MANLIKALVVGLIIVFAFDNSNNSGFYFSNTGNPFYSNYKGPVVKVYNIDDSIITESKRTVAYQSISIKSEYNSSEFMNNIVFIEN